ncbi:hypothetical protein [Desulfoluna spongiiphila]|uniref:Alginate export domain-containing protein n=1 Tax=Desulfoluna spongiiphila TaxID=419481 RepID=A0A1G5JE90_9BACT|nr:hypothetical protein [Desulfoluna spongiiphila]SCY86567.1 hypothetical protein SAMN05216233_12917 [Desulfoluna spongiiphila]VVS93089.1 hypothetical protein DBB_26570 [Desulfoluna spongiiphila]
MKSWRVAVAAALFLMCPRGALAVSVDVGGQVKASVRGIRYDADDARGSLDPVGESPYDDLESSAGFRLASRTAFSPTLTLDLDYELFYEGGDATKRRSDLEGAGLSVPGSDRGDEDRYRLFDLTSEISDSSHHRTVHRLDRLSLNKELGSLDVRIGRQAVTWGGGLLFNPMDLVNPFSPTDTLRDYKAGDDLASFRYTTADAMELQAIGRPGRDGTTGDVSSDASSYATKLHGTYGSLEGDILVASHRGHTLSGVGFSGYAGEAAWRSDLVVSDEDGGTLSAVANMDLSWIAWGKNWYGLVEFYHNGYGTSDYAAALTDPDTLERLDRGEVFTLGKNYLAVRVQLEAHPLVNLTLTAITNTGDPSGVLQPTVVWDARQNLRLDMVALLPWGASETEYGGFTLPGGSQAAPARELIVRGTLFF